jgi:cytochrome o ubiquinol oxidase operon protein cyoD
MSHEVKTANKAGKKTLAAYVTGLILSLILTFIAFWCAHKHQVAPGLFISGGSLVVILMSLAVVQLFVQAAFFLRLNSTKEGQWDLMPFLFVIFVVVIFVAGSLWIMWSLNYNMMH